MRFLLVKNFLPTFSQWQGRNTYFPMRKPTLANNNAAKPEACQVSSKAKGTTSIKTAKSKAWYIASCSKAVKQKYWTANAGQRKRTSKPKQYPMFAWRMKQQMHSSILLYASKILCSNKKPAEWHPFRHNQKCSSVFALSNSAPYRFYSMDQLQTREFATHKCNEKRLKLIGIVHTGCQRSSMCWMKSVRWSLTLIDLLNQGEIITFQQDSTCKQKKNEDIRATSSTSST